MTTSTTDEAEWAGWPLLRTLPVVPRPTGRVVVVSAHPDDEVLGAGGLIAALAGTAPSPIFVTVTDGEASHPGSPGVRPGDLAEQRAAELVSGLRMLGHQRPTITRLGLPDSGLAPHVDELAQGIGRAVTGADLVLCPAVADGHIDHATVGRVTLQVCRGRAPVWQFPIWVWHWTLPGADGVPWDRARRFEISSAERARKRAALACFTTQTRPLPADGSGTTILPPEVLAHFDRPYEMFFT